MIFDQRANGWPLPPVVPGRFDYWPKQFPPPLEPQGPTQAQFEEFLALLRAAKKRDIDDNAADCGNEEKLAKVAQILTPAQLKQVREILGF